MEENHRLLTGTGNVCTAVTSPMATITSQGQVEKRRDPY